MDSFWLELMPALVAAGASLLGIVVGVSQFTSAARLRRRATFWSEQLEAADLVHDRAVAQSMHREATASLIALQAYPGKTLLWQAQFILIALYGVGATGYIAGTLAPDRITVQNLRDQGIEPALVLVLATMLSFGLTNVADTLERRRRMARQYLDGQDLVRERQGAGDTGPANSFLTSLGLLAFSTGICLLIAVISFAAGTPKGDPSALALGSGWYLGGVVAGVLLIMLGLGSVFRTFFQTSNEWRHPRALSPEAGRRHEDERPHDVQTGIGGRGDASQVSTLVKRLPALRIGKRSTNS